MLSFSDIVDSIRRGLDNVNSHELPNQYLRQLLSELVVDAVPSDDATTKDTAINCGNDRVVSILYRRGTKTTRYRNESNSYGRKRWKKLDGRKTLTKLEAEDKKKPPETGSPGQKAGAECQHCGKKGHTPATCWTKNPELVPKHTRSGKVFLARSSR